MTMQKTQLAWSCDLLYVFVRNDKNKQVDLKVFNHHPNYNCGIEETSLYDYRGWSINTVV